MDSNGTAGGQGTEDTRGQAEDSRGQDAEDTSGADEEEEEEFNGDLRCCHGEYGWNNRLVLLRVAF